MFYEMFYQEQPSLPTKKMDYNFFIYNFLNLVELKSYLQNLSVCHKILQII